MTVQILSGVRTRVDAGFGLWHMAHASKAPLTVDNYVAARTAMMRLRGDRGRIMGIVPNTRIVPPGLEDAALHIVNTEMKDGAGRTPTGIGAWRRCGSDRHALPGRLIVSDLTATCAARALDGGPAPELVHLLPPGAIRGRDGRRFTLAGAAAFIARTAARGTDLPIDYEHQSEDPARQKNGPVPAAGWIRELTLRPDGIWGRVEWTKTARNMIAARAYRHANPVFTRTEDGQMIRLTGAGRVPDPDLELTALSRQETDAMDKDKNAAALGKASGGLHRIAAAPEPAEDADAGAVPAAQEEQAAANRAAPDPAR